MGRFQPWTSIQCLGCVQTYPYPLVHVHRFGLTPATRFTHSELYLLLCVLAKLDWTRVTHLVAWTSPSYPGEAQDTPSGWNASKKSSDNKSLKLSNGVSFQYRSLRIHRLPLAKANNKLCYVPVDIALIIPFLVYPLTGGLKLFNLYVAFPRSSGWPTICLLRDFGEKLFPEASHIQKLIAEDDRSEIQREGEVMNGARKRDR